MWARRVAWMRGSQAAGQSGRGNSSPEFRVPPQIAPPRGQPPASPNHKYETPHSLYSPTRDICFTPRVGRWAPPRGSCQEKVDNHGPLIYEVTVEIRT
jgi:hypothetical protein